jgi:hypothetical protein
MGTHLTGNPWPKTNPQAWRGNPWMLGQGTLESESENSITGHDVCQEIVHAAIIECPVVLWNGRGTDLQLCPKCARSQRMREE